MKFISYPKIKQYKDAIREVEHSHRYAGLDDDGEVIYDYSSPLPTLDFKGTVKLHGTNAGVCYNVESGRWYQSRKHVITPENDNAGFASFAESKLMEFTRIIGRVYVDNDLNPEIYTVSIFGEWAGGNIQGSVGLTQLSKKFYIFGVKISNLNDPEFKSYWVDSTKYSMPEQDIYNVDSFETFDISIDFNSPKNSQNKLGEITQGVEDLCPVTKSFGFNEGVGEGVVWRTEFKGEVINFKIKGEKHSISKVKTLAPVDSVKLESVTHFANITVTDNRIKQGLEIIFPNGNYDRSGTGKFIKWVVSDILSEEQITLEDNNLTPKDVGKALSLKARIEFFKYVG